MDKHYICIEAGADAFTASRAVRRGRQVAIGETVSAPWPPGAFGDVRAMAEAFRAAWPSPHKNFKHHRVIFWANMRQTALRFAALPRLNAREREIAARECLIQAFPGGDLFNESTHVFGYSIFTTQSGQDRLFMAALPAAVSEALVGMCREWQKDIQGLQRIDTVEHLLARHYGGLYPEPLWLCLPQEHGFRILALYGGLPYAAYWVSDDPLRRETELSRLWRAQQTALTPQRAVLVLLHENVPHEGAPHKCGWLHTFLTSQSVEVVEEPDRESCHRAAVARSILPYA